MRIYLMKHNEQLFLLVILTILSGQLYAATITVNTADVISIADDGFCTMYEAVTAVNNNQSSGNMAGECIAGSSMPTVDVIEFDVSILPAYISPFVPFELIESVEIRGPSRDLLFFTSQALGRSFIIDDLLNNATYTIKDVTFQDNNVTPIPPFGDNYGGAIYAIIPATSELNIERVNFINNTSPVGGGALAVYGGGVGDNSILIKDCLFDGNSVSNFDQEVIGGGAIFIALGNTVVIQNSTFVDNIASNLAIADPLGDAAGGAILIRSPDTAVSNLIIESSTFSNNQATGVGGAISVGAPGFPIEFSDLTVKHSTMVLNTSDSNDNQLPGTDPGGGAIWAGSSTAVSLLNNIIALNLDNANNVASNLAGGFITGGFNFVGDNSNSSGTFPAGQPNVNMDWVGTLFSPLHPQLEALANNGGPTPTHLPMANSLVVDQGKCNAQNTDQRYNQNTNTSLRIIDINTVNNALTGCDIGAVEIESNSANQIPLAEDDNYNLLEGETLIVPVNQGLLDNDFDTDTLVVSSAGVLSLSNGSISGDVDVNADGTLDFQTDDMDANGVLSFQYLVTDLYNEDEGEVVLNVIAVNDEPTFTPGVLNINVALDQSYVFPQWATDIVSGPANESNQSLIFATTLAAPIGAENFFSNTATVDTNGTLNFQINAMATGTGQILVTLVDDGGTSNGGDDHSSVIIDLVVFEELIFENSFE